MRKYFMSYCFFLSHKWIVMPKLMAAMLSRKRMFEALREPTLLPSASLLGDGIVLYATQPERKRRADVGEDVDGRSRIKRKFYLRIVTVGAIGAAALLAVGVVQEIPRYP